MKKLLTLSLILNVVLIYFYFEEINQPPIERIVMEKKGAPEGSETPSGPKDNPGTAPLVKKQDAPKISDRDVQIIVQDEQSFIQASDEIGIAQNKFLEDLEISEGFLKRKEKLTQEYFKQTGSWTYKFQLRIACKGLPFVIGKIYPLFPKSKVYFHVLYAKICHAYQYSAHSPLLPKSHHLVNLGGSR
jgi:hypothetical protein